MKDLKYLIAYIAPIAAIFAIHYGGFWSPAAFYIAFVIIPFIEFLLPGSGSVENNDEAAEESRSKRVFFDILLYSNIPLLYSILYLFLIRITTADVSNLEIIGMTLSVGVVCGVTGINVAHELGHRETWYEQTMSKILLLGSLYMHFFIEHNRGHHKNVSTDEDPASSRLGENVYAFFYRSVTQSYVSAWHLEAERLMREGKPNFSFSNEMIWYQIIQLAFLTGVYFFFGNIALLCMIIAGIIGFLLLELVNYIEHYGLRRRKLASGRYEKVLPLHSWNSNHELGRIFLYELTRHSDHHYKATRKYQILRHFDESPQLPYGYPASMLLALVPPLWFSVMDSEVLKWQEKLPTLS